jgi:hypothetical protein
MNERKPKCGECADAETCKAAMAACGGSFYPDADPTHCSQWKPSSATATPVPADPSPEVVERVARAICDADWLNDYDWQDLPDGDPQRYMDEARAAIRAMGGKP